LAISEVHSTHKPESGNKSFDADIVAGSVLDRSKQTVFARSEMV
jgi:hypothetical protein